MPNVDLRLSRTRATIGNGTMRCEFARRGGAWTPDWFYLDDRPMLRFKDHEWMSLSVDRPTLAHAGRCGAAGLRFSGRHTYYGVPCDCSVTVSAAPDGPGFTVESAFTPLTGPIELYESGTSFECPCEYDGRERSTTVIGQNPVYRHEGDKVLSGLYLESALWVCNRKPRARQTGPCWAPLLAQRVSAGDGSNERCIMLLGHYDQCTFKEVYATPTRSVGPGSRRGYKYLVGCANWSSSLLKDPTFVVARGRTVTQKVTVDFRASLAPLTLDAWLVQGWGRMVTYTLPRNGRVRAYAVARRQGVDWSVANRHLAGMFHRRRLGRFWDEARGVQVYLDGSRPQAGGDPSPAFAQQWYGPLSYQARIFRDRRLARRICALADRHADPIAAMTPRVNDIGSLPFIINPCLRTLQNARPRPARLERAIRTYVDAALELLSGRDAIRKANADYGSLAGTAEMLLLAGEVLDLPRASRRGLQLLDVVNAQLDGEFWRFGCGPMEGWCQAGRQIRALGPGRATLANLLAVRHTGRDAYRVAAGRFVNYNLAICYASANGSPVADMDTRGWANGGTCGRDQWAEMPPLESMEGTRAVAAILNRVTPIPAYYDAIFLAARTGLCMLPAARTHKRAYDTGGRPCYTPVRGFANERAIYRRAPFVSYENPWDQTMQAGYQAVEPLMNTLVFGGGIARVADERLVAIVPDAAHYAYDPAGACEVHVWNPTSKPISATLDCATRPARARHRIVAPDGTETAGRGARGIPIAVPARSAVRVFC